MGCTREGDRKTCAKEELVNHRFVQKVRRFRNHEVTNGPLRIISHDGEIDWLCGRALEQFLLRIR
jgi:hypothetical protein